MTGSLHAKSCPQGSSTPPRFTGSPALSLLKAVEAKYARKIGRWGPGARKCQEKGLRDTAWSVAAQASSHTPTQWLLRSRVRERGRGGPGVLSRHQASARDPLSRCQQETSLKYRVESRKCVRSVHRIHIHFRCGIMFKAFTEKQSRSAQGTVTAPRHTHLSPRGACH